MRKLIVRLHLFPCIKKMHGMVAKHYSFLNLAVSTGSVKEIAFAPVHCSL